MNAPLLSSQQFVCMESVFTIVCFYDTEMSLILLTRMTLYPVPVRFGLVHYCVINNLCGPPALTFHRSAVQTRDRAAKISRANKAEPSVGATSRNSGGGVPGSARFTLSFKRGQSGFYKCYYSFGGPDPSWLTFSFVSDECESLSHGRKRGVREPSISRPLDRLRWRRRGRCWAAVGRMSRVTNCHQSLSVAQTL